MSDRRRNIVVLGSTGSIGRSALDVVSASKGRIAAVALSANTQFDLLCQQALAHKPRWVLATDTAAAEAFDWSILPKDCELKLGEAGLREIVQSAEVDVVLSGIVGSAGLLGTWAALEAGKTVALANKETLVMAGAQVLRLARKHNAAIIPVDSEHSAVFQAMACGRRDEISRVVLTASGGPFRDLPAEAFANITVQDALAHPTWEMGPKISVDSATMMNKALEIIEACWLFDLPTEQIDVVIHPQSIVHSFVEYIDGSVIAQLSPPDMRLPIQYAIDYPDRFTSPTARLDWSTQFDLQFIPPDPIRFPALQLGHEVAKAGGTAGAVLNAANEAAVTAFLEGEIGFNDIVPACKSILENHSFEADPTLEKLLALDAWARQEIARWICSSSHS